MKQLILGALIFIGASATAEVFIDDLKGDTTFRVDGKIVSSVEAIKAAAQGLDVYRCKPKELNGKKVFFTSTGEVSQVVECSLVDLKINPKTGAPSWKNRK